MPKFQLSDAKSIAGFAAEHILAEETGEIIVKGFFNSDEPQFHVYIDQIYQRPDVKYG